MNKHTIIETIRAEKPFLKQQFGVEEIALFGSFARGDASNSSDIDILVKLGKPSYSALIGLYDYLQNKLKHKVDVIRWGPHLSQRFMDTISKELIYA